MRKLTPLPPNPVYVDRFIQIRDRKHHEVRNKLLKTHNQIITQYEALELAAASHTLESLASDPACAGISDALRACYESPTKVLQDLKTAIKSTQPPRLLRYCPMCGTTVHSTFDHYMPATRFPEFAVHPLNLVPCCARCNSTKSDSWLNATGTRQYLHAYTDLPPEDTFLATTLHESPGYSVVGATFNLVRPDGIDNIYWKLIESHFDCLCLLDRYNNLGNDEIAEILSSSRSYLETHGKDVRTFLEKEATDRENAHGKSHWRAVLLRAMARHGRLEHWIAATRPAQGAT
ncbi:MAG: hypothetical protein LZF86_190336 [Nitrospira sp.]|nr:MAG: hypothetical protein LZF86_190336 [Nitrospira sp.]